jgi:hypothetical protein
MWPAVCIVLPAINAHHCLELPFLIHVVPFQFSICLACSLCVQICLPASPVGASITSVVIRRRPRERVERVVCVQKIEVPGSTVGQPVLEPILSPELAVVVAAGALARWTHVDIGTSGLAVDPDGVIDIAIVVLGFAEIDRSKSWSGYKGGDESESDCVGLHDA